MSDRADQVSERIAARLDDAGDDVGIAPEQQRGAVGAALAMREVTGVVERFGRQARETWSRRVRSLTGRAL